MLISTNSKRLLCYNTNMKVKLFDESHEEDLENEINSFLEEVEQVIDIKFSTSSFCCEEEQIFCFSAMILYET